MVALRIAVGMKVIDAAAELEGEVDISRLASQTGGDPTLISMYWKSTHREDSESYRANHENPCWDKYIQRSGVRQIYSDNPRPGVCHNVSICSRCDTFVGLLIQIIRLSADHHIVARTTLRL